MKTQLSTRYTLTDRISENKDAFTEFIKIYKQAGGLVNETTIALIKNSMDAHGLTILQVTTAYVECFEKEQFMNWANIMKYVDTFDPSKSLYTFETA